MTTGYEAITESEWKDLATTEITHLTDEEKDYLPRAWDEWIARVKRDAAREALDGLIDAWLGKYGTPETRDAGIAVRDYRETNYRLPEEAP